MNAPTIEDTKESCEALDTYLRQITTPAGLAALIPLAEAIMAHHEQIDLYFSFPAADRRYVITYRFGRTYFEIEALGGLETVETPLGNRPRWTRTDWRSAQELKNRKGQKSILETLKTIAPLNFVGRALDRFSLFVAYRKGDAWQIV